jgi:hypothetical protein
LVVVVVGAILLQCLSSGVMDRLNGKTIPPPSHLSLLRIPDSFIGFAFLVQYEVANQLRGLYYKMRTSSSSSTPGRKKEELRKKNDLRTAALTLAFSF